MELVGFIGTATVAVDPKGRCSLPRELRKQLPPESSGQVVVTIFSDRSLALRPVPEWNRYVLEDLEPLAKRSRKGANFVMMVTSMAKKTGPDVQNRITLSQELMQYAGIKKEVTFAGDGKRIRLWNPQVYLDMLKFSDNDTQGFENCFYDQEDGEK